MLVRRHHHLELKRNRFERISSIHSAFEASSSSLSTIDTCCRRAVRVGDNLRMCFIKPTKTVPHPTSMNCDVVRAVNYAGVTFAHLDKVLVQQVLHARLPLDRTDNVFRERATNLVDRRVR
jgi:hypothetical protein